MYTCSQFTIIMETVNLLPTSAHLNVNCCYDTPAALHRGGLEKLRLSGTQHKTHFIFITRAPVHRVHF